MLNDIPLIIAAPVAAVMKLVDLKLCGITIIITIIDIINMFTYLTHIEQLSINSDEVYKMVEHRKEEKKSKMEQMASATE
jgi:hypothetical protein